MTRYIVTVEYEVIAKDYDEALKTVGSELDKAWNRFKHIIGYNITDANVA